MEQTCDFCDEAYSVACVLGCGHSFHSLCLHRWWAYSGRCPLCRSEVQCTQLHDHATTTAISEMYLQLVRQQQNQIQEHEAFIQQLQNQQNQDGMQIQIQQVLLLLSSDELAAW